MEQTAVEWLEERYNDSLLKDNFISKAEFDQAKALEKEQKGYSEEEVRLAYFQGEKDSYVKGGQTKQMENEFIKSLKNKLNK